MWRLGKFPTILFREGELETPTLPCLTGLWAGNILGPLQSSCINSLWGIHTSPRPPGNTEPLMTGPSLRAGLWKLPTSSLHSRESLQRWGESQVKERGVQQEFLASATNYAICSAAVRGLKHCSKVTTNYNATAVFPSSLSFSINFRPTYLNLKTKREKLFNILSRQLSSKSFWMNLVHWSQQNCLHQLQ